MATRAKGGRTAAAPVVQALDPDVRGSAAALLSREQKLELYYWMRLTRSLEERLVNLYRQTKVVGGLFRSLGQEADAVGSAFALDKAKGDILSPLIRNMGAMLVRGAEPTEIIRQYMAKGDSPTREPRDPSPAPPAPRGRVRPWRASPSVRRFERVRGILAAVTLHEEALHVPVEAALPHLVGVDLDERVVSALGLDRHLHRA